MKGDVESTLVCGQIHITAALCRVCTVMLCPIGSAFSTTIYVTTYIIL